METGLLVHSSVSSLPLLPQKTPTRSLQREEVGGLPGLATPVRGLRSSKRCGRSSLVVRAAGPSERPPNEEGEPKFDWDRSWKAFQDVQSFRSKRRTKGPFQFMEKYVTRSPTDSKYPIREEGDEFRRTERSALNFWTSSKFTFAGFGFVVGLFVYMVIIVGPPPTH